MKLLVLIVAFISYFILQPAHAEYRAFMLHIVNEKNKVTKQVLSTLDPDQYRTQYPLSSDEKITYVQTWRCFGRTDNFTPICDKPDKKPASVPSQSPENSNK